MYLFILLIPICYSSITDVNFNSQFIWKENGTVTQNNTYRITNISQQYYYIDVKLLSEDPNFYLLVLQGQAPYLKDNTIPASISVDWNGQIENRLTRFMKIQSQGKSIYFTTLSTTVGSAQTYQITVRGSSDQLCPNDCNNSGYCDGKRNNLIEQNKECVCIGAVGNDCHQQAGEIKDNESNVYDLDLYAPTFLYYRIPNWLPFEPFGISFTSNCDAYIYFEKTNILYIPTGNSFNSFDGLLYQSAQISQSNTVYATVSQSEDISTFVFAALLSSTICQDTSLVVIIGQSSSGSQSMSTTTIIVISIVLPTVFLILVASCFFYRRMKLRQLAQIQQQNRYIVVQVQQDQIVQQVNQNIPGKENTNNQQIRKQNSLDEKDVKNLKEEDNCAICLDKLLNNNSISMTPCHHYFHHECIAQWLEKTRECPNCRARLQLEQLKNHRPA